MSVPASCFPATPSHQAMRSSCWICAEAASLRAPKSSHSCVFPEYPAGGTAMSTWSAGFGLLSLQGGSAVRLELVVGLPGLHSTQSRGPGCPVPVSAAARTGHVCCLWKYLNRTWSLIRIKCHSRGGPNCDPQAPAPVCKLRVAHGPRAQGPPPATVFFV